MVAYKLVVAEWSPSVQRAIKMAFPESEFEIYPFRNGIEAEEELLQIKADAILLSLSLPNKDGYDVGRFIRRQEQLNKTPLILLKGAFDDLDKKRIAGLDYDEIIQEPFDSEKLVRTVRDVIEGNKEPHSLPEEPVMVIEDRTAEEPEEDLSKNTEGKEKRERVDGNKATAELERDLQAKIKEWVKQESLNIEKDLEKRIGDRVLLEIKKWLRDRDRRQ